MSQATDWFYKTDAWKNCRDAYMRSVGGLCEKCLKEGRYEPGEIVHHKVHLNAQNVNDPSVSLNWENLVLLCRQHHADEHRKYHKRYKVNEFGQVESL